VNLTHYIGPPDFSERKEKLLKKLLATSRELHLVRALPFLAAYRG
jgi:hypothetical protein